MEGLSALKQLATVCENEIGSLKHDRKSTKELLKQYKEMKSLIDRFDLCAVIQGNLDVCSTKVIPLYKQQLQLSVNFAKFLLKWSLDEDHFDKAYTIIKDLEHKIKVHIPELLEEVNSLQSTSTKIHLDIIKNEKVENLAKEVRGIFDQVNTTAKFIESITKLIAPLSSEIYGNLMKNEQIHKANDFTRKSYYDSINVAYLR